MMNIRLSKNSKILLSCDLHFNIQIKSNNFLIHMKNMVDEILESAKKEKVDCIILLGDIFDTRNIIASVPLFFINDLIYKLSSKFPLILIEGNHEKYLSNDNQSISFLDNYKNWNNVEVVNKIEKINIGKDIQFIFMPYMTKNQKTINSIQIEKENTYLFSHFGVASFLMNDNYSSNMNQENIVSIKSLSKFKHVYLGHYHGYQDKKNITYCSAPLQSKFGDESSKHGWVILDLKNETHEFIENKVTPQFITLELNKENIDKMLNLENHFIRIVITNKKFSNTQLYKLKTKLLKNNYEVKFHYDIQSTQTISTIEGWSEIIFKNESELLKGFLTELEKEKKLKYDKQELIQLLEI